MCDVPVGRVEVRRSVAMVEVYRWLGDKLSTASEAGVVNEGEDLFAVLRTAAGKDGRESKEAERGRHPA
jgi:hypothetical protein